MLAICDAEKPVAVGGIMGGLDSSISETTANVLLEVAYFKRENIRQTSRKLNLATEASYRFERGVDIENLKRASDRATELICEFAGGVRGEFIDVYPTRSSPISIVSEDISHALKRLTGLEVKADECVRILNELGIEKGNKSEISDLKSQIFTSPSWRHDLAIEEDLIEEIARHAGYDHIAEELPPAFGAGEYQPNEMRKLLLRQTLTDLGFDEAISYSFIDTSFDETFEPAPEIVDSKSDEQFITLRDSVIEGALRMRPSLLPGLLAAVRTNFNHKRRDISLFEIGKVFAAKRGEDRLPNERELLSIIMTGSEVFQERALPGRALDFYDAKGAIEAALNSAGVNDVEFAESTVKHLRLGQSAAISVNGKDFGYIGRLNDDIAAAYKFKQPIFAAEVDLETLLTINRPPIVYRPLPKFPSIVRDVSLIAKRNVSYTAIKDAIIDQDVEICRSVQFVDVYEGKGIGGDERSITVRFEYRSDERTLIEEEVEQFHAKIVASLETELGVNQRF